LKKPYIKVLDVRKKVVVVRVIGSQEDVDLQAPMANNFFHAGAAAVIMTNHLIGIECLSDSELKEMGLKRIDE
jgi:hypothetical protein